MNFISKYSSTLKLFGYSLIGIFFFFIPVTLGEKSSIPIDHIVTFLKINFPFASKIFALLIIATGAVIPFINKSWNKNKTTQIFSILKVAGLISALTYFFRIGPPELFANDLLPFLYEKLVVPVGLIVPIGAIFLAFLVDYGLLEFIGVIMEHVMRPVWKTPGRSAVDALASFVGSYSIALLITDKVYAEGKYTPKEAVIIATGFSTVSATFMIIVAKTTGLIDMWNFFFWSTLTITFIVTALTVRIPPLSNFEDSNSTASDEKDGGNIISNALKNGIVAAENSLPVHLCIKKNFIDGIKMTMSILPSILSIGLIGLLLSKFTPVFDWLGYLYFPVVKLLRIPEALLVSKAVAVEIAEMFLPALLIKNAVLIARYVVSVTSISAILFFSASIPTILSTRIPVKVSHLLIIWVERTFFSLLLAALSAYLFLG